MFDFPAEQLAGTVRVIFTCLHPSSRDHPALLSSFIFKPGPLDKSADLTQCFVIWTIRFFPLWRKMLRPSHFWRPALWDSTEAEAVDYSPLWESCIEQSRAHPKPSQTLSNDAHREKLTASVCLPHILYINTTSGAESKTTCAAENSKIHCTSGCNRYFLMVLSKILLWCMEW